MLDILDPEYIVKIEAVEDAEFVLLAQPSAINF